MKKSLFMMILFTGFSIGVWIWGIDYINQGKEKVELTEQVIYGDLEKAKGILLQIDTQWDQKLFWSTSYPIGASTQPETKFQFQPKKEQDFFQIEKNELTLSLPMQFSIAGSGGLALEQFDLPYQIMFEEVAARTAAGEEHIEEVYLADYNQYYPLQLEVQSEKIASIVVPEHAQEMLLQSFPIPILPTQKGRVIIQKNKKGEIVKIQYDSIEGGISIQTSAVILDTGCYFSFACYNEEGELLDIKPDGKEYGIYLLPFHWETKKQAYGEEERYAVMEYEQITCVYPLETVEASALVLKEDGTQFLLVTKEADKLVLSLIQKDTGELLQRIEVLEWKEGNQFQSLELQKEGLLFTMTDGTICFLSKEENDLYQKRLQGDLNRIEDRWERNMLILEHSFLWDGERLVLAGFPYWRQNSVYLAVFQETGMVFLGFYQHSGDLDWKLGVNGIQGPICSEGKPILQIYLYGF